MLDRGGRSSGHVAGHAVVVDRAAVFKGRCTPFASVASETPTAKKSRFFFRGERAVNLVAGSTPEGSLAGKHAFAAAQLFEVPVYARLAILSGQNEDSNGVGEPFSGSVRSSGSGFGYFDGTRKMTLGANTVP
jgi:hypothetical protein